MRRSDSFENGGLSTDRLDTELDRTARWKRIGATVQLNRTSRDGRVSLALARYPAYEGAFAYSDRLNIYMCAGGMGRIVRRSEAQALNSVLYAGRVGLGVPGTAGEGSWDDLSLLALSIDFSKVAASSGEAPRPDAFVGPASRLHDDPLLTAVMTAMWRYGEAHGLSSAFFDSGVLALSQRLLSIGPVGTAKRVRPLAGQQLTRVLERIEAAISEDVTVLELATVAGMSQHHFCRAFRAATGMPPYRYLTRRRIEHAKRLLAEPGASVTEVALAVGFSNASQFAATFRRIAGKRPSAWQSSN